MIRILVLWDLSVLSTMIPLIAWRLGQIVRLLGGKT